jgi:predicted DNA-binding transcriptional regulator AlpA
MTSALVPLPEDQPLLDLLDAALALGIGRTTAYTLAAKGEFPIPVLRVGGRLKVRTADLRRYLGLSGPSGTNDDDD